MAELSTIARPYAEAAFASAKADNATLESWSGLLSELSELAAHTEVRDAMSDPRISIEQRITLFTELVKNPLTDNVRHFIELLVENDRVLLLPQIAQQFEGLRHQLDGSAQADIISAFPLSDEQVAGLMDGLEKKFNLKLKPVVTVDPDLIGGVRVVVGDQVLDTSVQARLGSMRDTLVA